MVNIATLIGMLSFYKVHSENENLRGILKPGGIMSCWFGGGSRGVCVGGLIGGGWLVSTIGVLLLLTLALLVGGGWATLSFTVGMAEPAFDVDCVDSESGVRFLLPKIRKTV